MVYTHRSWDFEVEVTSEVLGSSATEKQLISQNSLTKSSLIMSNLSFSVSKLQTMMTVNFAKLKVTLIAFQASIVTIPFL